MLIYLSEHFLAPFISVDPAGSNGLTVLASFTKLFVHTPEFYSGIRDSIIAFLLQVISACLFPDSCRHRLASLPIAVVIAETTISCAFPTLAFDCRVQF